VIKQNRITAAEAVVRCLEIEGINTVFGYPGAAICPLYDKLLDSGIEHILVRHEANAGHAANGYARISGKPAVCAATSGPGATNLITAIATAYIDSVPLIVITGQVTSELIGLDVFQEADITGSAEPFVKHSYLVKEAEKIPKIMKEAFYIAKSGRPGPVLIDIPIDVFMEEISFGYPETVYIPSYKPRLKGNTYQIKKLTDALQTAEKPLICAGGGVFASNSMQLVREFAERTEIPVVTTLMGLGTLPDDHTLNFGMLGMHGVKYANAAVQKCDLLLLFGARAGDRSFSKFNRPDLKVVHIDVDPAEIGKKLPAAIPVVGNLKFVLEQLLSVVFKSEHKTWLAELQEYKDEVVKQKTAAEFSEKKENVTDDGVKTINPKAFIKILNGKLPGNTIISADVGQNQIWMANYVRLNNGRFITSGGMGTMGYALPAAIGAKKFSPASEVIAVCGDGGFQMQFMELATMIQHGINVKVIVFENGCLGMVREYQKNNFANRLTGVALDGSPDFTKFAEAYGIESGRICSIETAETETEKFIQSKKPYLLSVSVSGLEPTLL
jgi:acetolactate synthase-1/2/3 large subunit